MWRKEVYKSGLTRKTTPFMLLQQENLMQPSDCINDVNPEISKSRKSLLPLG